MRQLLTEALVLTGLGASAGLVFSRVLSGRVDALFRRLAPSVPDVANIRNYIEWVLRLPWRPEGTTRRISNRFGPVVRHLNRSHVGLEDVKQRISEFLAVRQLGGGARAQQRH